MKKSSRKSSASDMDSILKSHYSQSFHEGTQTPERIHALLPELRKSIKFDQTSAITTLNSVPANRQTLSSHLTQKQFIQLIKQAANKQSLAFGRSRSQYLNKLIHWTQKLQKPTKTDLLQQQFKVRVYEHQNTISKTLFKDDLFKAFDKLLQCSRIRPSPEQYKNYVIHLKSWCEKNPRKARRVPNILFEDFMMITNSWFIQNKPEFERIKKIRRSCPQTQLLMLFTIIKDYLSICEKCKLWNEIDKKMEKFTLYTGQLLQQIEDGLNERMVVPIGREITIFIKILKYCPRNHEEIIEFYNQHLSIFKQQDQKNQHQYQKAIKSRIQLKQDSALHKQNKTKEILENSQNDRQIFFNKRPNSVLASKQSESSANNSLSSSNINRRQHKSELKQKLEQPQDLSNMIDIEMDKLQQRLLRNLIKISNNLNMQQHDKIKELCQNLRTKITSIWSDSRQFGFLRKQINILSSVKNFSADNIKLEIFMLRKLKMINQSILYNNQNLDYVKQLELQALKQVNELYQHWHEQDSSELKRPETPQFQQLFASDLPDSLKNSTQIVRKYGYQRNLAEHQKVRPNMSIEILGTVRKRQRIATFAPEDNLEQKNDLGFKEEQVIWNEEPSCQSNTNENQNNGFQAANANESGGEKIDAQPVRRSSKLTPTIMGINVVASERGANIRHRKLSISHQNFIFCSKFEPHKPLLMAHENKNPILTKKIQTQGIPPSQQASKSLQKNQNQQDISQNLKKLTVYRRKSMQQHVQQKCSELKKDVNQNRKNSFILQTMENSDYASYYQSVTQTGINIMHKEKNFKGSQHKFLVKNREQIKSKYMPDYGSSTFDGRISEVKKNIAPIHQIQVNFRPRVHKKPIDQSKTLRKLDKRKLPNLKTSQNFPPNSSQFLIRTKNMAEKSKLENLQLILAERKAKKNIKQDRNTKQQHASHTILPDLQKPPKYIHNRKPICEMGQTELAYKCFCPYSNSMGLMDFQSFMRFCQRYQIVQKISIKYLAQIFDGHKNAQTMLNVWSFKRTLRSIADYCYKSQNSLKKMEMFCADLESRYTRNEKGKLRKNHSLGRRVYKDLKLRENSIISKTER